jgi:flagellar basal-body rod modification protein FlgD
MNIQGMRPEMLATTPTKSSPTSSSTAPTSSSSSTSSNSTISETGFLQLIATELQAQDPTQPLDPSQFMGQLVQFGTLNEVTSIYNLLSNGATASAATSPSSTPPAANSSQATAISH